MSGVRVGSTARVHIKLFAQLFAVSFLAQRILAAPLQWEEIRPVGDGPAARDSHAMARFDTSQDSIYLFGGRGETIFEDTWELDAMRQGWSRVEFSKFGVYEGACEQRSINDRMPGGRFGHAMASSGKVALMCGGQGPEGQFWNTTIGLVDCWWFYPSRVPVWAPVKLKSGSEGPTPRTQHTIVFDDANHFFVLYAGTSASFGILGDCWYLGPLDPELDAEDLSEVEYEWLWCGPPTNGTSFPRSRAAHSAAFFSTQRSMFVFGGFEALPGEGAAYASNDMWRLDAYAGSTAWRQVLSISAMPEARAFHAMWLSGIKLWVHGGEGFGGAGAASVLGDTWSHDIYTGVWSQYGTSDSVPVAARLAVLATTNSEAYSFGGQDLDGFSLGKLFHFTEAEGWMRVKPSGPAPHPRAGHIAAYEPSTATMVIHGGATGVAIPFGDLWAFDMQDKVWECIQGAFPECRTPVQSVPFGPGPRMLHASASLGLLMFTIGGSNATVCVPMEANGVFFPKPEIEMTDDMWVLNLATFEWRKVESGGPLPPRRIFPAVTFARTVGGLSGRLMMFGGATIDCVERIGRLCDVPQPMNDAFSIDTRPLPTTPRGHSKTVFEEGVNRMLSFDGIDDVVSIYLPTWCASVESLSVLWIDAWVYSAAVGAAKAVFFDMYNDRTSVLRWWSESIDRKTYIKLQLYPDGDGRVVKTWGPLSDVGQGYWHHIAFTLRFARVFLQTSISPGAAITQAFCFIDGELLPEAGTSFLDLNIEEDLVVQSGFTQLFLAGPGPRVAASEFGFFRGSIDNLRLWWPPCPHNADPTRCNPYAFLYPKLADGTRVPESGVHDHEVTLEMVAKPIKASMFSDELPWDPENGGPGEGCLLFLDFNYLVGAEGLVDRSLWKGPSMCDVDVGESTTSAYCAGCDSKCTFSKCSTFDLNCVSRGVADSAQLAQYAELGTCDCLNVADCPEQAEGCNCPDGTHRVCTECLFRYADQDTGMACNIAEDPLSCIEIAPDNCPPPFWNWMTNSMQDPCLKYECSCYDRLSGEGVYVDGRAAPETGGHYCNACPAGKVDTESYQPLAEPIVQAFAQAGFNVTHHFKCCNLPSVLVRCTSSLGWVDEIGLQFICLSTQITTIFDSPGFFTGVLDSPDHDNDCGIARCCVDVEVATPPGGGGGSVSCTSFFVGQQLVVTCDGSEELQNIDHAEWEASYNNDQLVLSAVGAQNVQVRSAAPDSGHAPAASLRAAHAETEDDSAAKQAATQKELGSTAGRGADVRAAKTASETTETAAPAGSDQGWSLRSEEGPVDPLQAHLHGVGEFTGINTFVTWTFGWDVPGDLRVDAYHAALTVSSPEALSWADSACGTKYANSDTCEGAQWKVVTRPEAHFESYAAFQRGTQNPNWSPGVYRTVLGVSPATVRAFVEGSFALDTLKQGMVLFNLNSSDTAFDHGGSYCGNGVVEAGEVCDDGQGYNNQFSPCDTDCQCSDGWAYDARTGECDCTTEIDFTYSVRESTSEAGADNTIEVATFMWRLSSSEDFPHPMFTISGLTGSGTPDQDTLPVACSWAEGLSTIRNSESPAYGFCPPLALPPVCDISCDNQDYAGEVDAFRISFGEWRQETGTYKIALVYPPQDNFCGTIKKCDPFADFESAHLRIRFTIRNPDEGQPAIHPELKVCGRSAMSAPTDTTSRPVLGALQKTIGAGEASVEVRQSGTTVASASLATPLGTNEELVVHVDEALVNRGVTQELLGRLPAGASFPGFIADLSHSGQLVGDVQIKMAVDPGKTKAAGGCVQTEDGTLQICVRGWPGLYQYDEDARLWAPLQNLSSESAEAEEVGAFVSGLSKFAVVNTVPCCNYEGEGRACGDRVCTAEPADTTVWAVLGAGTASKYPAIEDSTRPIVSSMADLKASYSLKEGSVPFRTRSPWVPLLPNEFYGCATKQSWDSPELNWIPARFGHALTAVTGTRVMIYGGIGCLRYSSEDACSRVCVELKVLSDLWEYDAVRFTSGLAPFVLLEMSPALDGLVSAIGVPVPGLDSELILLGGSKTLSLVDLMQGRPLIHDEGENFEYRRLQFREGKVEHTTLGQFSSVISHSAVYNASVVVLFGGYVRNRVSSATLVYELEAASPSVALDRTEILALGPAARASPALIKPDAQTLFVYGGVGQQYATADLDAGATHPATNELWHLDLSTQKWTKVHDADIKTGPRRTSFYATAPWVFQDQTFIMAHGGYLGAYTDTPSETAGRLQDSGFVWPSSQYGTNKQEKWYGFFAKSVYPGPECCDDPNADLSPACGLRPVYGCTPQTARAMHAAITGRFAAGEQSIIVYGGYKEGGLVTSSMWYYVAEDRAMGFTYSTQLVLRGVAARDVQAQAPGLLEFMLTNGIGSTGPNGEGYTVFCPSQAEGKMSEWRVSEDPRGPVDGVDRTIIAWTGEGTFTSVCLLRALFQDRELFDQPDAVYERFSSEFFGGTALEGSSLDWSDQADGYRDCAFDDCALFADLYQKDGLMDFWQFMDREDCAGGCRRAVCQGATNLTLGAPEYADSGRPMYCYAPENECGDEYECGLPMARAGHRLSKFVLGGTNNVMLMFGGEKTDLSSTVVAELSNAVHAGFFSLSSVTFTKLWVSSADGLACDAKSCAASNCPCPRRDASMDVIRNSGSNNGKLIVFGGMAATGTLSPAWAYLHKSRPDAVLALNDIWYLDLDGLTAGCLERGECDAPLPWTKVDLPGTQAPARWGAGMVLDTSDNLYITGGATVDGGAFIELGDFYVFQLLDPFYRKCSATGRGLTHAVAGTPATFFLQCMDALGEPADGARFRIDISGPVDMSPQVLPLGRGEYTCTYLPVKASAGYQITIKVGRGGEQYQDLISGVDADASNSVHEYRGYDGQLGVTNPNPFALKVEPGRTDATTSLAQGDFFSLSTCGTISSFTVLARDSFLNRRPGGDSISVLIEAWDDQTRTLARPTETPKTAKVTDNSDGSYAAIYTITQGGMYRVSITFGGVYGAQTPAYLVVNTAPADPQRTYAYGGFLNIRAGASSALWVQTRDRYGNALRVHPLEYPAGSEAISFELCQSTGDNPSLTCRGGQLDTNVGITIDYSYGTDGKQTNNGTLASGGTPYWGLYRIQYFPYNFGAGYTIEVLHARIRVACYFNTEEDPPVDPGGEAADECLAKVQAMAAGRRRLVHSVDPAHAAERRRAQPLFDPKQRATRIDQAFVAQDTAIQLRWLFWAPIVSAIVAVLLELLLFGKRLREKAQEKKVEREMHAEIPGLVLADPDQKLPEPTRAMPLHDSLVFSKPNAHDPVARIPEDAEVPEDDARSLVRRLQGMGMLSEEEAAAFTAGAEHNDPRSARVMEMHMETLERTAQAIRHMSGHDTPEIHTAHSGAFSDNLVTGNGQGSGSWSSGARRRPRSGSSHQQTVTSSGAEAYFPQNLPVGIADVSPSRFHLRDPRSAAADSTEMLGRELPAQQEQGTGPQHQWFKV